MSSYKTQLTFRKIHARFAERSVWWNGGKFDTTVLKKNVRAENFLKGCLLLIYHNIFIGIDTENRPIYNGFTSL